MEYNNLLYRRQFILANSSISHLKEWRFTRLINETFLYSHPDLPVVCKSNNDIQIVLLGSIYDYQFVKKDNTSILTDLFTTSNTFDNLVKNLKIYTGQYAIVFIDKENATFNIIQDPLALREVYYCSTPNKIICASQPNFIVEFSEPKLHVTDNPELLHFYNNEFTKIFSRRNWIGDESYFNGIKHLLPNHYLNIVNLKSIRYWPNSKIEAFSLKDAVNKSCFFLKNTLQAASIRENLMIAVTAGFDSRLMLAASLNISDDVYYFINKTQRLSLKHPDITIPSAIFNDFNIPFNVHNVDGEVDVDFSKVFFQNTFLSSDKNLPSIYNAYYKKGLSNHLNILAVGEIGRSYFGTERKRLNGYKLARLLGYKKTPYVVNQCQKWYDDTKEIAEEFNINILTLLSWEQHIGNWGSVGNSESDIVIEEFDPFASHYLLEIWLGVSEKYLDYDSSILFYEMINHMCPTLLNYPINPSISKSQKIRVILKKMKIYTFLKRIVHMKDELIYNLRFNFIN